MARRDGPARLPPAILFGGSENVAPLVRSFGARGIPVYVLNERWAELGFSRYVRRLPLPEAPPYPQSAITFLTSSASDFLSGSVLLAGLDEEVALLAEHQHTLSQKFQLDLANPVAHRVMLDKLQTYRAARAAGVATPRFWEIHSADELTRWRDEFVYPLIIKPRISHLFQRRFSTKFMVVDDYRQLQDGIHVINSEGLDVVLVEKIPGPDSRLCSYYTYLDEDGNALFDFTKRVLRRYPSNMGIGCYHVSDRVEHVREPSLKLCRHVGLTGLANVEFKLDHRDGQLKLIECNVRFTAANSLVAKADFDLGNFVYNRIVGIAQPPLVSFRTGVRLWDPQRDLLAFLESNRRGEITLFQWLRSIMHRQTLPLYSWRDPVPSAIRLGIRMAKVPRYLRLQRRLKPSSPVER